MNTVAKYLASPALLLTTAAAFAQAPEYGAPRYQEAAPQSQQAAYQPQAAIPQRELDSILAPIALYPDSLLSQLLMAATFPGDVAQAARWSRANPSLQGDAAVQAVANEPWDPAVKSLVAFPDVLKALGDQPDWTQRLGEAFATNEGAVMQTVQQLRARADQAGNLRSSEQLAVERVGSDYVLEPANPETVYVPYYDPRVAYGDWWWPGYAPVYWGPWAGYGYYGLGFGWGRPIYVRSGFWYGGFNWRNHHVHYHGHRPYYYNRGDYSRGWHGRSNDRRDNWRGDGRRDGNWDGRRDGRGGDGRGDWRDGRRDVRGSATAAGQQSGYTGRARPQYNESGRTAPAAPGVNPQDGSIRASNGNPTQRTVAPRYNADGIRTGGGRARPNYTAPSQPGAPAQTFTEGQRVSPVQRAPQAQRAPQQQGERTVRAPRPMPQQASVPNAGVQRNGYGAPMHAAPAPRAAPQSAPQAAPAATRGNHGGGRGDGGGGHQGGNRGGGGGNGHGRER